MYIQKLPSGKYRAQVKAGGEHRWTHATRTRGEAQQAAADLIHELGADTKPNTAITVRDMLHAHIAEQADIWSPTYLHDAKAVIDKLGRDRRNFLDRRLRDVSTSVLLALYRDLGKKGWTRWRMKRLHTVLGTAWKMAVTYEWAVSSPCVLVKPPTPEDPDLRPPTDAQVAAILGSLTGLDQLAIRLNGTLGIRRGDLVGLQWPNVDLERSQVLISQSIAWTPGQRHIRPTKSGKRSHRNLALDLPTATLLRRWRAEQVAQALADGMPTPLWVFSDDGGVTPWRPDRVTRLFRRAADRVGADCRLHDLRHYVATSMLNDGESTHDVAGQLGNTPATVEAKYRHWLPGRGRESVDKRAARLGGGTS